MGGITAAGGVTTLNGQKGDVVTTDFGAVGSTVVAQIQCSANQTIAANTTIAGSALYNMVDPATSSDEALTLSGRQVVAGGYTMLSWNGPLTSIGATGTWRILTRIKSGIAVAYSMSALLVRVA